jgi:hypothetical protein
MEEISPEGDGNCLFRAISFFFKKNYRGALGLRVDMARDFVSSLYWKKCENLDNSCQFRNKF